MDIEWTDTTGYSRGERGAVEPKTWNATRCGVRVVVTRHMDYPSDVWTLYVIGLKFSRIALVNEDIDDAKVEAIAHVRQIVADMATCWGAE